MQLRKWYLDCTAGDGTVFIGYAGTLGFGPLHIPVQTAALYPPTGAPPVSRWRLATASPSLEAGGGVRWQSPDLRVRGVWSPRSGPFSRVLLATPGLRVEWRCHLPRGWARVELRDRVVEGWGYVEEMVVEGNVRRLPLRQLHWGRFLSESDHLVWLCWKGPHPLQILLANGEERGGVIERDAVMVDGVGHLLLPAGIPTERPASDFPTGDAQPSAPTPRDPGLQDSGLRDPGVRVLADRRVGDAFFPSLPPLRWILPRILSGLRERKLSGRGRFEHGPGRPAGEGWLLYETVEFP